MSIFLLFKTTKSSKALAKKMLARLWGANGQISNSKSQISNTDNQKLDLYNGKSLRCKFFGNCNLKIENSNYQQLVIILWPQWLQYAGYIFLALCFSGLSIFYFKDKTF